MITRALLTLLLFAVPALCADPAPTLNFGGTTFIHRWHEGNQHEFTPSGQENLNHWTDMITVVYSPGATDGDGLALFANAVLENYKKNGASVLATSSVPRTPETPAEHFVSAQFTRKDFTELVFVRFKLIGGTGTAIIAGQRRYGAEAEKETAAWLKANGDKTEKSLMALEGIPSQAELTARLPRPATASAPAPVSVQEFSSPSAEQLKQLPPADAGFAWVLYRGCAVLTPAGWNQRSRPDDTAKNITGSFAVSPETFSETKYFDHGFTVQVHSNIKQRAGSEASKNTGIFAAPLAKKISKEHLLLFNEGGQPGRTTCVLRYVDATPGLTPLVIHRYYIGDDASDRIYAFTYECPQAEWEANWPKYGEVILKKILLLATAPAAAKE